MGSFERLLPTINPRRMLGTLDRLNELLSDEDVDGVVNKDTIAEVSITNTADPGIPRVQYHNFVKRFLTELRCVSRYDLVRESREEFDTPNGVVMGAFVSTDEVLNWPESLECNAIMETGNAVLTTIKCWKKIEKDIRGIITGSITQLTFPLSSKLQPSIRQSLIALRTLLTKAAHDQKGQISEQDRKDISDAYADVLEEMNILYVGLVTFLVHVILQDMEFCSDSTPYALPDFIRRILPSMHGLILKASTGMRGDSVNIRSIPANLMMQNVIAANIHSIREYFKNIFDG